MNIEQIYERETTLIPSELPLVIWPDDRLNHPCQNITRFDVKESDGDRYLSQLAIDMIKTMTANEGLGLAAPQVGILAKLFVLASDDKPLILINPKILEVSDEMLELEEGCLSVPGYFEKRKRSDKVIIRFQDVFGNHKEFEFRGLYAFAVQHEIDHLQGKMFVDSAGRVKRQIIKSKIKKYLRNKRKI